MNNQEYASIALSTTPPTDINPLGIEFDIDSPNSNNDNIVMIGILLVINIIFYVSNFIFQIKMMNKAEIFTKLQWYHLFFTLFYSFVGSRSIVVVNQNPIIGRFKIYLLLIYFILLLIKISFLSYLIYKKKNLKDKSLENYSIGNIARLFYADILLLVLLIIISIFYYYK